MKVKHLVLVAVAAAFAASFASPAGAADAPGPADAYAGALARVRAIEQQLVSTVAAVSESSVSVINEQIPKEMPGQPVIREPVPAGVGSGVIIVRSGRIFILTNQHVVEHADKLEVIVRDGTKLEVEVVDAVQQYDIALLRFSAKKTPSVKGVPVVGRKSAELEEGQWCVATGNPFQLAMDGSPVVTLGVVSGLDRVLHGNFTYGCAIQHDAAVNPGNSGGPLWNLRGEFVGINGMIQSTGLVKGQTASNMGASYSIPVAEIDAFLAQLMDAKKDARAGVLGVACETDTDQTGKPIGARVSAVSPRSPAADPRNGLHVGDVIVSISSSGKVQQIRTGSDLTNALSLCPAGTRVTVSYRRRGKSGSWSGQLAAE